MKETQLFLPYRLGILCIVTYFCYHGKVSSFQTINCSPKKSRHYNAQVPNFSFGKDNFMEWGLVYYENTKRCPITPVQVVNDAFDAIAGTLYNKQKLDPSIVNNARSNSLFEHRPTRGSSDEGRIGIEIDGAEFLFSQRMSPDRAQRLFSLILAAKVTHDISWNAYENENYSADSFRTVTLSFNTIKEALLARRDMQILQNNCRTETERDAFNHIIIQSLSDDFPSNLCKPKSARKKQLRNLSVDARRGLLIVVQPTDFNQDYDPARPSLHSLNDFQKTITCATLAQVPIVVLSPRFLSYGETEAPNNEIYQSGFQRASYYGGIEPPRGPSPFILRDFSPPSYCWIGDALSVSSGEKYEQSPSARLILTNSVMDEDHPWHIYAAETQKRKPSGNDKSSLGSEYLASTRSASGRPTRALMRSVLLDSYSS